MPCSTENTNKEMGHWLDNYKQRGDVQRKNSIQLITEEGPVLLESIEERLVE